MTSTSPGPFFDDDDEPEHGFCYHCGCEHRLDLGCVLAEERGRMVLLTILTLAMLVGAIVCLIWGLL